MKHTIFLLDDHSMMLKGLKFFIENNSDWKITGQASSGEELISLLKKTDPESLPEIIIYDIQLGKEQSFEAIKTVSQKFPEIKGLVYSMYDTTGYFLMAKENGAMGYLLKSENDEKLLEALEKISKGQEYFEIQNHVKLEETEKAMKILTKQERKIFDGILNGKTNQQLSEELKIKQTSVEVYISRMYAKLNIKYRNEFIERYK